MSQAVWMASGDKCKGISDEHGAGIDVLEKTNANGRSQRNVLREK